MLKNKMKIKNIMFFKQSDYKLWEVKVFKHWQSVTFHQILQEKLWKSSNFEIPYDDKTLLKFYELLNVYKKHSHPK